MGIKRGAVSDPEFAQAHDAGTPILLIQQAEHAQFGTVCYEMRPLWVFHYLAAKNAFDELSRLHEVVLRQPVAPNGTRLLTSKDDPDITLLVYTAGTNLALNVVLAMQHFCHEIERSLNLEPNQSTLAKRIKETFDAAGLKSPVNERGYAALREVLERRDAIEHPKPENTFNFHENNWDKVPLSWFLTERSLKAFDCWAQWLMETNDAWQAHPIHAPKSVVFTVKRGIKSTRQAKKPPKS